MVEDEEEGEGGDTLAKQWQAKPRNGKNSTPNQCDLHKSPFSTRMRNVVQQGNVRKKSYYGKLTMIIGDHGGGEGDPDLISNRKRYRYSRFTSSTLLRNSLRWCLLITVLVNLVDGQTQYSCPGRSEISPCSCTVKKNGLDILCEFTDAQHINKAMAALKGKTMTIYYLKLRHNTLRKLQGFIFLGLDIRHLTIHNSTLAAVEESSLSSIGKLNVITGQ